MEASSRPNKSQSLSLTGGKTKSGQRGVSEPRQISVIRTQSDNRLSSPSSFSPSPPTRPPSQNSMSPPIRSPLMTSRERPFSEKSRLSRSLSHERVTTEQSSNNRRVSEEIPRGSPIAFAFPQVRDRLGSVCLSRSRSNSDATIPEEPLSFNLSEVKKLKSAERDFNRKGVVWTNDGRLVIINFGNDQLKVFNENFQESMSRKVPEGCRGISIGAGANDVAVTCQRRVYNYRVNDKMITDGKCFVLNGNGYGVSYAREHYGVTVDIGGEGKSIALLNEDGRMVQQVEKIQRPNETQFKAFHLYLSLDPHRNVIYLSDVHRDMLLCVSFTEKLYWECKLPGKPRGICVVGNHVIVATTGERLCVLSKEGTIIKEVPGLGYDPESLAYHDVTQRLAVSQYYKGWVHVYQIT